jgi:hypothetical protein
VRFAEWLVAGDDQAGALVSGGDELEEQVGGFGFERDVADLVDHEDGYLPSRASSGGRRST